VYGVATSIIGMTLPPLSLCFLDGQRTSSDFLFVQIVAAPMEKGKKMKIVDQKIYDDWKSKSTDPYSARCFSYAEDWANKMEIYLAEGIELEQIAEKTSHEADTDGITGFMYGAAVSILAQCWEHGEELRRWHNRDIQIGTEGDEANDSGGVLNPAILNIGKRQ
jgi:hypothetical protein